MGRLVGLALMCCLLAGLVVGCGKPKPSNAQIARFLEACRTDDAPAAEKFLRKLSLPELVDARADYSIKPSADPPAGLEDMWVGWTALHAAALNGNASLAEALIEAGADVDARARLGATPLHWTIAHRDVAELLIANGADVDARSEAGSTPLLFAAGEGQAVVAELLIDNDADLNAANETGRTPLHAVAAHPFEDPKAKEEFQAVAGLLIANGAEVNAADEEGNTPLSLALRSGNEDIARLLRENGAEK